VEFARISMADLRVDETDVEAILGTAGDRVADRLESPDATISIEELPPVEADEALLETLFERLLENAVRHGGTDEAPVTATVTGTERDDRVVFEVSDDGPGIPREFHEEPFEIFEQRHRDSPGTGMGLAIRRRIIDQHGGEIDVESAPDEGATVRIARPAGEGDRPTMAATGVDVDRL
jgi:signal transduction histidine kinase